MKKHLKKMLAAVLVIVLVITGVLFYPTGSGSDVAQAKGITVHFKWLGEDNPHIYYSNVKGTDKEVPDVSWPGIPMKEEENNWYSYTVEDAASMQLVLLSPEKSYQTANMSREAGDWWFASGTWYSVNPDSLDDTQKKENAQSTEVESAVAKINNQNGDTNASSENNIIDVDSKNSQVNEEEKGITIHFITDWENPTIYYWNALPENMETEWPGQAMTAEEDKDGYYTYSFPEASKINLLFKSGEEQSQDLTRTTGEWWFNGKKWYKEDPGSKIPTTGYALKGDFREDTIYFLMTTRFYDGDSSNNKYCWDSPEKNQSNNDPEWRGDFKGLIEKIDYIKALGFSAIWITPVVENASGYDYHGYHAFNFKKVDDRYESDNVGYQELINACHEKGMKVVQDIVLNHTSNFGEENLYGMFEKEDEEAGKKDSKMVTLGGDKASVLEEAASKYGSSYEELIPGNQFNSRIDAMKEDSLDKDNIYHHEKSLSWESYTVQTGQIAGDCVDLNTENPDVAQYLREAFIGYINMGVDAFRVDTVKHISRLTFNNEFNQQFKDAYKQHNGEDAFYQFGEVCTRYHGVWNSGIPSISCPFYTWVETESYPWGNTATNMKSVADHWNTSTQDQPTSDNAFLKGNEYHKPDYSSHSGLDVIDFPMHWAFRDAYSAFGVASGDGDKYYNDSTWNVTYVDSHDYAPDNAPENQRFAGSQDTWAENLNLMFTFRGIPCIYYGSEIEFQKGCKIDEGPNIALADSGRAYFGDKIEGSVNVSDYGVYSNATGAMADTLSHPLAKHIQRLNLIRRAIPALQKGQYSKEGVSGGMAFKRRYTDDITDSFVCVSISGSATFTGIPSGTYVDVISGETVQSGGSLTTKSTEKGNMSVYVLQTGKGDVPNGKVGEAGTYLK